MAATKKATTKAKAKVKVQATPRKSSPKKSATPKEAKAKAAPAVKSKRAPAAKAQAPKKTAAKKSSALLRLSDKQKDFLKKIMEAGDAGYEAIKAELKSIEGLEAKKLVKKSTKGKAPARFVLTKAALKHVSTAAPATPSAAVELANPTA